jgi:hypothetical protein
MPATVLGEDFLDVAAHKYLHKSGEYHSEAAREKIRAAQLINRLQSCAMGEIELTMQQIRAIEILLRKCVPDLTATDISAQFTHRYVIEVPSMLSKDEWQKKYSGSLTTTEAPLELPALSEIKKMQ